MKTALLRVSRTRLAGVLLALSLTAAAVPSGKPEDVGLSSERLQRINELVRRYIESGQISGAVTMVSRHGRVAHFEAQRSSDTEPVEVFQPCDPLGERGRHRIEPAKQTQQLDRMSVRVDRRLALAEPVSEAWLLPTVDGNRRRPSGRAGPRDGLCGSPRWGRRFHLDGIGVAAHRRGTPSSTVAPAPPTPPSYNPAHRSGNREERP